MGLAPAPLGQLGVVPPPDQTLDMMAGLGMSHHENVPYRTSHDPANLPHDFPAGLARSRYGTILIRNQGTLPSPAGTSASSNTANPTGCAGSVALIAKKSRRAGAGLVR